MDQSTVCLLILLGMIICYITRIIPAAVTSVIGALLTALLGVNSIQNVTAQFANDVVLLLIGVMIIGEAFFEVGLADDLGRFLEKRFSNNAKLFLIIMIALSAIVAAFISNTATVALFIPLLGSVERSSGGKIRKGNVLMALSFASVLGGNATLFGSTPQLAVQSILEKSEVEGVRPLGVFELTKCAVPLIVLLILFYVFVGDRLQKKLFHFDDAVLPEEAQRVEKTAPLYKKIIVLVTYLACIVIFVIGIIPVGVTALLGASVCIALRCISQKKAFKSVEWGTVIMLCGILAFSDSFTKSGAGEKIVSFVLSLINENAITPMLIYTIIIVCAVLLTSVMSNTAIAAMIAPIAIEMAHIVGADPMTFVVGAILAANISFCTPIATPPVAMTMSAGYKFSDYFIVGGLFTLVATAYVLFGVPLICGF